MLEIPVKKELTKGQNQAQSITLDVEGMKCAGCVKSVERQLTQHPGVISASVNLITSVALVEYEPKQTNPEILAQHLSKRGFESKVRLAENSSTAKLSQISAQKRQQEQKQQFWQLISASLLLLFSSMGHLHHLGFVHVTILSNMWFHWGLATLALLIPGREILQDGWRGLWYFAPNMNTLVGLGTMSAYLASCVALIFPQLGWECFFDEPVMLLGFIFLGRVLESRARGKASQSLEALLSLQPQTARLVGKTNLDNDLGIEIPVEQIKLGEWVRVLAGEKIPVDGTVIQGSASVDESLLTGESNPVTKQIGDPVTSGTINLSGVIVIETTRIGDNTTLNQIISIVEQAQTRKAPIQKLADTVSGYFAYGVITIASVTFLFWYLWGTKIWGDLALNLDTSPFLLSLKLAISVLVVACPCALGLATPTAILVGTGIGAEKGLLIKGGDVLEKVNQINTIVFDKTGTLTQGSPQITDLIPLTNLTPQNLLQLAASVEKGSNHPFAQAILKEAQKFELSLFPVTDFVTTHGRGISAQLQREINLGHWVLDIGKETGNKQQVTGEQTLGSETLPLLQSTITNHQSLGSETLPLLQSPLPTPYSPLPTPHSLLPTPPLKIYLGNESWLREQGIQIKPEIAVISENLQKEGKTVVYLALNETILGLIALADLLRPSALPTVTALHELGLQTVLLSGDQPIIAQSIAHHLGINTYYGGVHPQEKSAIITALKAQEPSQTVAMVGDGVNDAIALIQADLGVAMRRGAEVTLESAGIVLMRDNLLDLVEAIKLSKAVLSKIRQNLAWAFAYNLIAIPIAGGFLLPWFGVLLNPPLAAALMAFSSIMVVTNSLLLRY